MSGFSRGYYAVEMRLAPQELRTYFVTFSTAGRRRVFQVEERGELMIAVLQHYRETGRFALHAFAIMPDHLHLLVTPAVDVSLEKTIQFVKGGFSFRLKSKLDVWERGHFDKRVPDKAAYEACVRYIDENPVKAGLVENPNDFRFSSAGIGIDGIQCLRGCNQRLPGAEAPFSVDAGYRGLKPAATPDS